MKIKPENADKIYKDFLEFCPKMRFLKYKCNFDDECLCGKCIILYMIKNYKVEEK